ncbi:hypothetical protein ACWGH7_16660 [Streptomyces cyaneofuscatus]
MERSDVESILWDCVQDPTDNDAHFGYQGTGITKLAELIVEQDRRIGELEKKVAELSSVRTAEQEGQS